MASSESGAHLYHLVQEKLWTEAQATGKPYYPPTYTQDGFTHLTKDSSFLLGVANHFYKDIAGPWLLLVLDATKLTSEVKYEAASPVGTTPAFGESQPDVPLFPHLYGPIDSAAVERVLPVDRDEQGAFLGFPGV